MGPDRRRPSSFQPLLDLTLFAAQPMFPTWVFGSPSGQETGDYLALDLGGTNLRVVLVSLQGDSHFNVTQSKFRLTEEQKQEEGKLLFDFCAKCVKEFIDGHLPDATTENPVALGFTFSYPCFQERIDHGVLMRWTKGFGAPNVEGSDVVDIFRKSLKEQEVPVELLAIINDTTGTLIASQYVRPRTKIGEQETAHAAGKLCLLPHHRSNSRHWLQRRLPRRHQLHRKAQG